MDSKEMPALFALEQEKSMPDEYDDGDEIDWDLPPAYWQSDWRCDKERKIDILFDLEFAFGAYLNWRNRLDG